MSAFCEKPKKNLKHSNQNLKLNQLLDFFFKTKFSSHFKNLKFSNIKISPHLNFEKCFSFFSYEISFKKVIFCFKSFEKSSECDFKLTQSFFPNLPRWAKITIFAPFFFNCIYSLNTFFNSLINYCFS